ncbi:MAG TPA: DUF1552 domain-containing protein [Steroidobacteraceae bacterium]|nr:DUF1552 domain-containing protein [Steroidobacteraceae bacterium]
MFLTKKHLSRRTVLKGAGVAIALPLLDAMIPAATAFADTAAAVKPRLGFVYFPHGAVQKFWTPEGTGKDFTFSRILKPLEPMREYVSVVTNLRNKPAESTDPHGIVEATWLTCLAPTAPHEGPNAGISIDQVAARQIGGDTPLPSLELCGEPGGSCNFHSSGQGLPLEGNPRHVFTTMFGPGDSNAERKGLLRATGSLLDYVQETSKGLSAQLDASDRALVSDYLESVREVEKRVQKLSAKADSLGNLPNAPLGAPDDFGELLDIQFEMIALAFQTQQTRIATMRMVKEASMRTYPQVNVDEAFHPLSHHGEDPEKFERLVRIQAWHTDRVNRFAKRLASIKEGNGNVLDNSIILFGSNMANSDLHNQNPIPQVLLGKGGGIKGGQHLAMPKDTPHSNILLTMVQRAGVKLDKFSDSSGPLADI